MNENEHLKNLYRATQLKVEAPEAILERTLRAFDDEASVANARKSLDERTCQSRPLRAASRRRVPFYAAAACLAVAALGFGAAHVANSNADNANASAPNGIVAATNLDFTVKAYASGTQTPLAVGDNGMIVFSRASDTALATAEYDTNGSYTGCLFRVEAEGVKTVQAHISKGMLYRYDAQNATYATDAELLAEAASWKPMKRGIGDALGMYDMVSTGIMDDGLAKDDPNKTYQVQTSKRLGQTAELDYSEGDSQAYFGLWTNDPLDLDEKSEKDDSSDPELDAIANAFEGAELTITATFDDGRTSTQVIELHAGDFAAKWNAEDPDGLATLEIEPTLLDNASKVPDDEFVVRTVYGEVVSSSDEAFPFADEPVNEYENVIDDPTLFSQDYGEDFWSEGYGVEIVENGWSFMTCANVNTGKPDEDPFTAREDSPSLAITDVGIETVKGLLEGTQIAHTEIARMAPLAYWNRIVLQLCGFSLNDDLTPSDGASVVKASFLVSNTSSETKVLRISSAFGIGKIEGNSLFYEAFDAACPLMYEATKEDGTVLGWLGNDMLTLAPGESAQMNAYWEISDAAFTGKNPAIGFGANGERNVAVPFTLN